MSGDSLSAGIGILARNSLSSSRRQSQISLLVDSNSPDYSHHVDDRNWSWSYLRSNFRINDLSELYEKYVQRLQNAYYVVFLLLQMAISLALTCVLLIHNLKDESVAIPEVIVHLVVSAFCGIAFYKTYDENFFRRWRWNQVIISVLTVIIMVGADVGLSWYLHQHQETVRTPIAFQTLIIIYFFLPLPRKYQAVIVGALVSIIYLVFSGLILYSYEGITAEERWKMICADMVYYLCGNVVGLYSQLLSEITIRRAFLDRRGHIKSTIKKNFEKNQEEQLLSSILPNHISTQVKNELLSAITTLKQDQMAKKHHSHNHHNGHIFHHHSHLHKPRTLMQKKPFSNLYVEKHTNVTILYADIVNFTPLTMQMKADELVETLNDLFGRFDEAAAHFDCLRIKLLGDCYYCVSGIPKPTSAHAKNCVQLGFEMIEILKDIRNDYSEKLKVNVNLEMRIGIHTGKILSGLLGIYKWQYDIWSKDATIANHMEQAGQAGKIHITRQTKDILGEEFTYQPSIVTDKYLGENQIETFFIVPPHEVNHNDFTGDAQSNKGIFNRSISTQHLKRQTSSMIDSLIRKKSHMARSNIGAGVTDILNFRTLMSQVNEKMEKAIDEMPLRKMDQWCGKKRGSITLNETPILMTFNSLETEIQFQKQGDPLFKYYIGCAIFVLVCIGIVQAIIMPRNHQVLWIAFGIGFSFLLSVFPFVWVGYIWSRLKDPHREMDRIPEPKSPLVRFFYHASIRVTNSLLIRTLIYLIVSLLISTFAIIDVVECDDTIKGEQECQSPWYFTYSCALAFLLVNGFFRINYLLKLLLCVISLGVYSLIMVAFKMHVFNDAFGASRALQPEVSHIIYLIKIVLYLHIMDRQMEYINRLDFVWKKKLTEQHQEAQLTHEINTILIQNILPLQIAKIYMDPNRAGEGHNRYYWNISVMFASIPNFVHFYAENDLNDHGIKCLQLLNEIIVEFDQALVDYEEVEKIKIIGSTYMAACGLEVRDPGRTSNASVSSESYMPQSFYQQNSASDVEDLNRRRKNLLTLVRFASSMMLRLHGINKDAFQEFQLRVGIDVGIVVAGVIGSQKPLYDIWGDTVNLASRMDSTGEPGKIQVTEATAKLLSQAGVSCESRGLVYVKGKGHMSCYFVKMNDRYQIQFHEPPTSGEWRASDTHL